MQLNFQCVFIDNGDSAYTEQAQEKHTLYALRAEPNNIIYNFLKIYAFIWVQVSFMTFLFVLCKRFFGGWRHVAAARASPLAISRPAGNSGKKRGDDTCAFKNSTWDVKQLFSERRRTPSLGRFQTRRGVPSPKVDGVGPNFSFGRGRAKPGDHVGAVSACVLTPFPPNKHAGEASFLGRKRKAEFKEKWLKPGPRKRRKTWRGTPGSKWFDDSRTTPEVKKLKYWHNQTVVR